jgi:hypothetical protein
LSVAKRSEVIMTALSRLCLVAAALLLAPGASVYAADKPKEIRFDWATYNPVSMVLKENSWRRVRQGRHCHRLGADARLNKALEFSTRARSTSAPPPAPPPRGRITAIQLVHLRLFAPGVDGAGHRQGRRSPRSPTSRQARRGDPQHRSTTSSWCALQSVG